MDRIPVPGATRAHIVSVHYTRSAARRQERLIQAQLNLKNAYEKLEEQSPFDAGSEETRNYESAKFDLHNAGVPMWANGVRVMKAGFLQHAVVATTNEGH